MATKNKIIKDRIETITQKTPEDLMLNTILSDEREYLFSESAEKQLIEMHKVRELFLDLGSRSRVIDELVNVHKYSYQKALKAVTVTPQIFATIPQSITRAFWVDIHMQKIEATWKIAKTMEDPKSMAAADRNRADAIKDFLGTRELIDQSKLHLPDVEIGYHPEIFDDVHMLSTVELEQVKNSFRRRKKLQQQREISDIDYEEVR